MSEKCDAADEAQCCRMPTIRELRVLRKIAETGSVPDAAKALNLSVHTIERHVENVRTKTGICKIITMVLLFTEWGMLDPRELSIKPGIYESLLNEALLSEATTP